MEKKLAVGDNDEKLALKAKEIEWENSIREFNKVQSCAKILEITVVIKSSVISKLRKDLIGLNQ